MQWVVGFDEWNWTGWEHAGKQKMMAGYSPVTDVDISASHSRSPTQMLDLDLVTLEFPDHPKCAGHFASKHLVMSADEAEVLARRLSDAANSIRGMKCTATHNKIQEKKPAKKEAPAKKKSKKSRK